MRRRKLFILAIAVMSWAGAELPSSHADSYGRGRVESTPFDSFEIKETTELRNLRQSGAYKEACRRAEEFLARRGGSAALHLEYGRSLVEIGENIRAEKELRDSLAFTPSSSTIQSQAIRTLGDLMESTGRRKEARGFWNQLLDQYRARGVKGSDALGSIAVAAWRLGLFNDAKDIFMDATDPKLGEVSIDALTDFGYLFLDKYNATEALGVFRDCLKIDSRHAPALLGMALAKKYDGDTEVQSFSQAALKINPNLVGAWNALAQLAIDEEDYVKALKITHSALRVNSLALESLSLQAFCLYVQGNMQGFTDIEKKVLAANPTFGRFYYILAENLVSRRKYREAVDWTRKAIAMDPELWAAHVLLGMNLTRTGDFEEGRRSLQRAFDGDPYNIWAYNSLNLFDQIGTFEKKQSGHFIFRMARQDMAALSPHITGLAEEVYSKLTQRYGYTPDGPVQVEVYPDHGGFAVRTLGLPGLTGVLGVCFGNVIAIDSPLAQKGVLSNWGSTFWHEFVHVITLEMTKHNIPRWYSEGLSVYEEHKARPGWGDNLNAAFLRAYKSGSLMKASELNAGLVRPSSPEQVMLAYYQAGLICEMIDERYGFEKIRQSLLLFARNLPAEEVFRQTLGLDQMQMDQEYARYLDSRFRQVAARIRFDPEDFSREPPAKADLLKALESNPEDFWTNLHLGQILRKEGANAEAEMHLKKAQQIFPQFVEEGNPYKLLGELYVELKRDDDAVGIFKKWSSLDGNARVPLLTAAQIYGDRKDWASAADMLQASVFINPYDLGILKRLGDAAMECQKWHMAVAAYQSRAGLEVADGAGAHYDLARALLASGNAQESKREILKSLEIAPSYRKAQELLLKLSGEAK